MREPAGRRACVLPGPAWTCAPSLATAPGETGPLSRVLTTGTATSAAVGVQVTARQGPELDFRLDQADGYVVVTGSSQLVADAVDRPGAAVDGDPATAWMTAPHDLSPRLFVGYREPVTITGVTVAAPRSSLRRVASLLVRVGSTTRAVHLSPDGTASFPAMTGSTVIATFSLTAPAEVAPESFVLSELPLQGVPPRAGDPEVSVPCGSGPSVVRRRPRRPHGGHVDVAGAREPAYPSPPPCATPHPSTCLAGVHDLVARDAGLFGVAGVSLTGSGAGRSEPTDLPLRVLRWSAQDRLVSIGPGAAPTAAPATLVVDEGFNAGWSATAGGKRLQAVRVDGWRQGWVVPAGVTGAIALTYGPAHLQLAGLALGAAALVVLLGLASVRLRGRRRVDAAVGPGAGSALGGSLGSAAVAVLIAGPGGAAAWVVGRLLVRRHRSRALLSVGGLLAVTSAGLAWWGRQACSPWWWVRGRRSAARRAPPRHRGDAAAGSRAQRGPVRPRQQRASPGPPGRGGDGHAPRQS